MDNSAVASDRDNLYAGCRYLFNLLGMDGQHLPTCG